MVDRIERILFNSINPERLDVYITSQLPEFSRSRIQGLIKNGYVTVNGTLVTKTGAMLEHERRVEIRIPPRSSSTLISENHPLDIIFENGDVVVVNKPAGMVIHPSPGHDHGTLVHAALGHIPNLEGINGEERPGIVHRLDKDTSGLIIIAKNDRTHHFLQEQFKSRKVKKTYLALVEGRPPSSNGRVEAPIGRNASHRKLMAIVPASRGRNAITEYQTLESFANFTLLEVHPLTGRTHQIRVHLAFLGIPIVADVVYGRSKPTLDLSRQFLHASKLALTLPREEKERLFEAPLPADLSAVLEELRNDKDGYHAKH